MDLRRLQMTAFVAPAAREARDARRYQAVSRMTHQKAQQANRFGNRVRQMSTVLGKVLHIRTQQERAVRTQMLAARMQIKSLMREHRRLQQVRALRVRQILALRGKLRQGRVVSNRANSIRMRSRAMQIGAAGAAATARSKSRADMEALPFPTRRR